MKRWTIQHPLWSTVAILHFAAYLWLAFLARLNGPFSMDHAVRDFFQRSQDIALGWVIREWAVFGDWQILTVLLLLLSLLCSREMRKEFFLFFLLALGGGGLLGQLSKVIVGRARPGDPRLGFPSGHTLAALVTVGGLVYFAYRSGRLRRPLGFASSAGAGMLIVLGVGVSRMYTDSHWMTDVFGGMLLGVVMATGVALGLQLQAGKTGQSPPTYPEP